MEIDRAFFAKWQADGIGQEPAEIPGGVLAYMVAACIRMFDQAAEIAKLTAEIARLKARAAELEKRDDGAVTVEGWMYREEGGSFTFTPANMGGMERWESVTVTSRRRP